MHAIVRQSLLASRSAAAVALFAASAAHAAPRLATLHTFTGSPDGQSPQGGLALAANGVLVGTTYAGGTTSSYGGGTVFVMIPPAKNGGSWTESIVLNFNNATAGELCSQVVAGPSAVTGAYVTAPPTVDSANNIYTASSSPAFCNGTTVELAYAGNDTWSVGNAVTFVDDNKNVFGLGAYDFGALLVTGANTVIGTTAGAGAYSNGVIYQATLGGSPGISDLFSFPGAGSGANPLTGVVAGSGGSLYGTTEGSGNLADQTIFRWSASSGYTILHTFSTATGTDPNGMYLRGNYLYGTTRSGGTLSGGNGQAVAYRLDLRTNNYEVLWTFGNGTDGAHPSALLFGKHGEIFGNTTNGGSAPPAGTLYELQRSNGAWNETILWNFSGTGSDGAQPDGNLVMEKGKIYGVTAGGGGGPANDGTVFELTP